MGKNCLWGESNSFSTKASSELVRINLNDWWPVFAVSNMTSEVLGVAECEE